MLVKLMLETHIVKNIDDCFGSSANAWNEWRKISSSENIAPANHTSSFPLHSTSTFSNASPQSTIFNPQTRTLSFSPPFFFSFRIHHNVFSASKEANQSPPRMAQPLPPPHTPHLPRRDLRPLRPRHLSPRPTLRSGSRISAS